MPIASKLKSTLTPFSQEEMAAARAAARPASGREKPIEWSKGIVSAGGGVAATIADIRRARGPGKKASKEQVAIRLDPDVLGAFRAGGPGWQTRVNAALKEWLASRPAKQVSRAKTAA
jgi:uncharacterized protein (DUF4415 family)